MNGMLAAIPPLKRRGVPIRRMGRANYINDNFLTVEESPPFMAEFFN